MNILIESIITQLTDVQQGKLWMGDNFEKKLSAVSEEEAFVQPLAGLHSVAEIIAHLTAWRKETIIKIKTGRGDMVDTDEKNWLPNERLKTIGWKTLLTDYQNTLAELIELLRGKDDAFLNDSYYDADYKGKYPYSFVLNGMLHHDIYHLGQLGIIIKFLKGNQH